MAPSTAAPAQKKTSWMDAHFITSAPATATTGPLQVNVNSVSSDTSRTFEVPNPVITSISPAQVPANGLFTITGSGFGASQGAPGGAWGISHALVRRSGAPFALAWVPGAAARIP